MISVWESSRSRFRLKFESEGRLAEKKRAAPPQIQWRSFNFFVTA